MTDITIFARHHRQVFRREVGQVQLFYDMSRLIAETDDCIVSATAQILNTEILKAEHLNAGATEILNTATAQSLNAGAIRHY